MPQQNIINKISSQINSLGARYMYLMHAHVCLYDTQALHNRPVTVNVVTFHREKTSVGGGGGGGAKVQLRGQFKKMFL